MTRALEDRLLHIAAADDGSADAFDLTLCAAGSFIEAASTGAWSVRIASGALVLELHADAGATRRLVAQRSAAGNVRLDGRRVSAENEGGACAGQPARPRPGDDGQNPGQDPGSGAVADVITALGDKILTAAPTRSSAAAPPSRRRRSGSAPREACTSSSPGSPPRRSATSPARNPSTGRGP